MIFIQVFISSCTTITHSRVNSNFNEKKLKTNFHPCQVKKINSNFTKKKRENKSSNKKISNLIIKKTENKSKTF